MRPDTPRRCAISSTSAICSRSEAGDCPTDKRRRARARRTRAAQTLLAALEQDFDAHGAATFATLRTQKPQAWARLLSEVCQFRLLPKTPKPAPPAGAAPSA